MELRLAILGVTGLVGRELLRIIEEQHCQFAKLGLYASVKSAGTQLDALGQCNTVRSLEHCDFSKYDAAFFCVGDELSAQFVPLALEAGCVAVDKSNTFRLIPEIPLVVPHVNDTAVAAGNRLIANPNCTTIVLVHALAPLLRFGLKRLWLATYQSVSGAGKAGVEQLVSELNQHDWQPSVYPRPEIAAAEICCNVHGGIGRIDELGRCGEEVKLIEETRKILARPALPAAVHAVRVPVLVGHSIAVTVEFSEQPTIDELVAAWRGSPDVRYLSAALPTPVSAAKHDRVEIGRLRSEPQFSQGWSFFICGDNVRLGAALNGWRIFKLLIQTGVLQASA